MEFGTATMGTTWLPVGPAASLDPAGLHTSAHTRPGQPQSKCVAIMQGWKQGVFTERQVVTICEALQQAGDISRLVEFLWKLPAGSLIGGEAELRARAKVAFHFGNYEELYLLLQSHYFAERHHADLQEMWYKAHYREAEEARMRTLSAVDKYRVRKQHPLPPTITDGEQTVYCFKVRCRAALKAFYAKDRFPTTAEKKALAQETGLTILQVGNWFKNRRTRDRAAQLAKSTNSAVLPGWKDPAGEGAANLPASATVFGASQSPEVLAAPAVSSVDTAPPYATIGSSAMAVSGASQSLDVLATPAASSVDTAPPYATIGSSAIAVSGASQSLDVLATPAASMDTAPPCTTIASMDTAPPCTTIASMCSIAEPSWPYHYWREPGMLASMNQEQPAMHYFTPDVHYPGIRPPQPSSYHLLKL